MYFQGFFKKRNSNYKICWMGFYILNTIRDFITVIGKVSASRVVGRRFGPRLGYTKANKWCQFTPFPALRNKAQSALAMDSIRKE